MVGPALSSWEGQWAKGQAVGITTQGFLPPPPEGRGWGDVCALLTDLACSDSNCALKPRETSLSGPLPAPPRPGPPSHSSEAESIKSLILAGTGEAALFHLNWSEFALTPGEFCLP